MKKTLFLIFSGAIVIFSVICICSAPILNMIYSSNFLSSQTWGIMNCKKLSDDYKKFKDTTPLTGDEKKKALKPKKRELNFCNGRKAMYGLERASFIIDVILGFLCLNLGLLHYFDVGKPFEKVTGIIGLATGIIQFILTLVYVCYSGYIFTNDSPGGSSFYKADKDGAIATWDDSKKKYKCDFYDKDEKKVIYAKYSDLWTKAYNYDKEISQAESSSKYKKCHFDYIREDPSDTSSSKISFRSGCHSGKGYVDGDSATSKHDDCDKLYIEFSDNIENKYLYDRWVTTIIFACFIIVCDIGLAIFGFFLFKSDGSGL
jgi:hypothetical protein